MYCDHIPDRFGNGVGAPKEMYSRRAFEKWWKLYWVEQQGFRDGCEHVKSPHDGGVRELGLAIPPEKEGARSCRSI